MSLLGDVTGTSAYGRLQFILPIWKQADSASSESRLMSEHTLERMISTRCVMDFTGPDTWWDKLIDKLFYRRPIISFDWHSMLELLDKSLTAWARVRLDDPSLCNASSLPVSLGGGVDELPQQHRSRPPEQPLEELKVLDGVPDDKIDEALSQWGELRKKKKYARIENIAKDRDERAELGWGRANPNWLRETVLKQTEKREGQAVLALVCLYLLILGGFLLDLLALERKWQRVIRLETLISTLMLFTACVRMQSPDAVGSLLDVVIHIQAVAHLVMTFKYPRPNYMWGYRTRAAWAGALPFTWISAAYRVLGCSCAMLLTSFAAYGAKRSLDRRITATTYIEEPQAEASRIFTGWERAIARASAEDEEELKQYFLQSNVAI